MGDAQPKLLMTPDEFLAWEATQQERHDFMDGKVVTITTAGAERRHIIVSMNAAFALRQHLSGTRCSTFIADMKVAFDDDTFFYPDVLVTCSEADRKEPLITREPILVIEVLSPSTAAYDLGAKFARYQRIASLREIVFIDLDERRANVYRKGADGLWVLHPFDSGADTRFDSVDLTLPASALFADMDEEMRG